MASLVCEVSPHLLINHTIKSAEQVFYGQKTVYSALNLSSSHDAAPSSSSAGSKLKNEVKATKKFIDDVLKGHSSSTSSSSNNEVNQLRKDFESLKLDNERIHKEVDELRCLFQKLLTLTGKSEEAPAEIAPKGTTAPNDCIEKQPDEDFDLFGSDDEEESEEQARIREERLSAYAAKKAKKPGPIAKSSVILDVKPWDDETDLKEMEEKVRSIEMDGLLWGASKLIPVGYGIQKLQIVSTIEDEKVSVDSDLVERIQDDFADYVQSVDIVAFNKI